MKFKETMKFKEILFNHLEQKGGFLSGTQQIKNLVQILKIHKYLKTTDFTVLKQTEKDQVHV